MLYLLDTNVVSELRKVRSGKADERVAKWADGVSATDLYLSAISVQELETGVLLIERKDKAQGAMLRTWLDEYVLPAFAGRILPVDETVARRSAVLHVPNGHGKCATPDYEICHARSPHLNPLPQAGEEANESLREFHVNPAPVRDSLIAATGLVHGMTVVTRNVQDFDAMGVMLLNPWKE